jgi:hypothetical protein
VKRECRTMGLSSGGVVEYSTSEICYSLCFWNIISGWNGPEGLLHERREIDAREDFLYIDRSQHISQSILASCFSLHFV